MTTLSGDITLKLKNNVVVLGLGRFSLLLAGNTFGFRFHEPRMYGATVSCQSWIFWKSFFSPQENTMIGFLWYMTDSSHLAISVCQTEIQFLVLMSGKMQPDWLLLYA